MSTTKNIRHHRAAHLSSVGPGSRVEIVDVPIPDASSLQPGECLVEMECSGVCHSDLGVKNNLYPPVKMLAKFPLVGGHEGVGRIVAFAPNASTTFVVGQRVGIKWHASPCLGCSACLSGAEWLCQNCKFSGLSVNGTFQQYVVGHLNGLIPIPDGISSEEACPILCAGVTVYRALTLCNASVGEWVALPGAGGGLGHLAVQYAVAMGFNVVAIDSGADKESLCKRLGASAWVDFKESPDVVQAVISATGGLGAKAAIITTSSIGSYNQALQYLGAEGTLVAVGLPPVATLEINLPFFVAKTQRIVAVNVGNRNDCSEALRLLVSGKVKPHITIKELDDLQDVFEQMEKSEITGRVVLRLKKE